MFIVLTVEVCLFGRGWEESSDLVLRGSFLSLKRVDYQDSHSSQANMLLFHTMLLMDLLKSTTPFLRNNRLNNTKAPWLLKSHHYSPKQIRCTEFVEWGDVPISQLWVAGAQAPRGLQRWPRLCRCRIPLLPVRPGGLSQPCGTLHLKEELDLVLSERERRFK